MKTHALTIKIRAKKPKNVRNCESAAKSSCAYGLAQVSDDVTVRPHFRGGPIADSAVIHGKAVMMFGDGDNIHRA
jgi:hypothetical protein